MKYNIITDAYVTPGNVHDSVLYLNRLDHQIARFGFQVEAVALDSGYLTTPICKGLSDRQIFGVIAHRRYYPIRGLFPKWKFHYDSKQDRYICPNHQTLTYSTTAEKATGHTNQILKYVPHARCSKLYKIKESAESDYSACMGRS